MSRKRVYSKTVCWLIVLLLFSQAAQGLQEERHELRTYREGSVRVIETVGSPLYNELLFTFEPMLTLEQDPEREESLFYQPGEFIASPDGSFFVLDRGHMCVMAFDSAGKYVRSFGRKGGGPGEFELPTFVAITGDTLIIFDRSQMRATRFRTDGYLLDIITAREFGRLRSIRPLTGEKLVITSGRSEYRGNYMYRGYDLLIVNTTDMDTLAHVSTGLAQGAWTETRPYGAQLMTFLPYVGSPTIRYVPGRGIFSTDGDKPELAWYDFKGDLQTIIRLGLAERPMNAGVKREYESRVQRLRDEEAARSGRPSRPVDDVKYPSEVGYWDNIIIDDAGYIWLLDVMINPIWNVEPPWVFHVVSPEGRYLGMAELPERTGYIIDGRFLALILDEETGERNAVVYQIVPAVEGLKYPNYH